MKKNKTLGTLIFFLCVLSLQTAHSAIVTINFDSAPGSVLDPAVKGVGVIQFDITTSDPAAAITWGTGAGGALQGGWLTFWPPNPAQASSLMGIPAVDGVVATITYGDTFSLAVGNWLIKDANGISPTTFKRDVDYFINPNGPSTYTISSVPIPAAVWLLGSGLVGLVVLKRRKKA